ncbi:MAG TPA: PorP/SprF family type IX secretion system membrane protein [Flavipsychrobacter sp.]|nr:PorP/SprF family type IX secretion system membrane protein [Flavipsychrobacter sp.]
MKNTFIRAGVTAALALALSTNSFAQDVHFTQFNMSPLIVNPAFTGAFNGQYRVAAIYRDQWRSVTVPFKTVGVSVDAPIVQDLTTDDYLAAGVQLYNDRAGDANLQNFSGLASIAYHKFLGEKADKALTVGFQGGYTQKSFDLSKLYFENQFENGGFVGPQEPGFKNKTEYFTLNAGVAWSHSASENFGYTIGLSAMNLNQPKESFRRQSNSEVGLGIRYAAQVGAIAYLNDKFSIRPGVLYQSQSSAYELVAGNEFHLIVGEDQFRGIATGVFAGVWYRGNDAIMVNAGLEWKGFRFGLSYDYNTSNLKTASNGNGGFELAIRYVAPNPLDFARRLVYPCSRF